LELRLLSPQQWHILTFQTRSFLGQAPFFIIALILCWFILPDARASSTHIAAASRDDRSDEPESHGRFAHIDFLGAIFLGLAILALMLPVEIGGTKIPWTHPLIFVAFGAGALLVALFLATEAWWAKKPIFPLVLLRQRDVIASYVIMGCQIAAQLGVSHLEGRLRRSLRAADTSSLADHVFRPIILPSHRKGL
jgi:hypothetical protein